MHKKVYEVVFFYQLFINLSVSVLLTLTKKSWKVFAMSNLSVIFRTLLSWNNSGKCFIFLVLLKKFEIVFHISFLYFWTRLHSIIFSSIKCFILKSYWKCQIPLAFTEMSLFCGYMYIFSNFNYFMKNWITTVGVSKWIFCPFYLSNQIQSVHL